ncbi:fungal hydrophobin [Rhodocollybia butyracea]|uniref:Hydrophobin n=1 Tax=Rhodocollybia butyracea TaxID=206335 RepID=A0A9P5TUV7_9AGAR|nr:fungal hydrophobin [Rhodocollybia butyracea]
MQFKTSFITFALTTLSVITRGAADCNPAPEPASECTTGPIQCCETVECGTLPSVSTILSLLGIVLPDPDILIGFTCTPLSLFIGLHSFSCSSAQAVCCVDNEYSGLIAIDCVPVIL